MTSTTGYDKLARFMDNEQYAVFRKFKSLANRDLLYLQAELVHLEGEFAIISEKDRNATSEEGLYDRNWQLLSTSKTRELEGKQWEKALEIRAKLREYCPNFITVSALVAD